MSLIPMLQVLAYLAAGCGAIVVGLVVGKDDRQLAGVVAFVCFWGFLLFFSYIVKKVEDWYISGAFRHGGTVEEC